MATSTTKTTITPDELEARLQRQGASLREQVLAWRAAFLVDERLFGQSEAFKRWCIDVYRQHRDAEVNEICRQVSYAERGWS